MENRLKFSLAHPAQAFILVVMMTSQTVPASAKPNRLIQEKSPYLLQHAYNPVDWYPWGDEALNLAKQTGKPIFLSIGYSTCHWCHVMAHESFENPLTAAIMNRHFINIKVDREERPDIDAIYMTAVQALTGSGGWPMSVWLTPDLKPFFGGTYFPSEDRYGKPGFASMLKQLAEVWEKENKKATESAGQISDLLKQHLEHGKAPTPDTPSADKTMTAAFQSISAGFDPKEGGFGPAPKFPMPVYMDFLLWFHRRTGNADALRMVSFTMKKIAAGGIYDQLGGGFARYSIDETWTVPHFEKMLYDNAQLISVAVSLYQLTHDSFWESLTRNANGYVLRDLKHPDGAFYSAEDADSEGKEGTFYLWTVSEITEVLGQTAAEIFIYHFGLSIEGNFLDPHTRETGKNVLTRRRTIDETAQHFHKSAKETSEILSAAEKTLFDSRNRRPRPHRDDKILTEWNGLMISALANAGRFLNDPVYLEHASQAAVFLQNNLYDPASKKLYRRWRDGERKIEAQQVDYAMLIQGLLDLFEAVGSPVWLKWAIELQKTQDQLFFDAAAGGYTMNIDRADLLVRMKDDGDNVIASGNSIAVKNGLRLSKMTGDSGFHEPALKTLRFFSSRLNQMPSTMAAMTTALDLETLPALQVVVLGPLGRKDTSDLLACVNSSHPPAHILIPIEPGLNQNALGELLPYVQSMTLVDGKATVYVCENFTCRQPTTDPDVLKNQLVIMSAQKIGDPRAKNRRK